MASKSTALTFFSAALAGGLVLADTVWAAPPSPPANPTLVYINRHFDIEVSNADGTAKTVLLPQGGLRRPSWAPGGACASTTCHIVYEAPICQLAQFDLVLVGGVPTAQNFSDISMFMNAGSACAAEISPIGDKLVFGESNTEQPPSSLWTMDVSGGRVVGNSDVPIYSPADLETTIQWPTYSPDGKKIAFVQIGPGPDYPTSIKVFDTELGVVANSWPLGGRFLEWSPDGKYLAYSDGGGSSVEGIYIKNMTDPDSSPVRLVSGTMATWLGSSQLAFTATTGISVISISGGKITSLVKGAHHPKFRN